MIKSDAEVARGNRESKVKRKRSWIREYKYF